MQPLVSTEREVSPSCEPEKVVRLYNASTSLTQSDNGVITFTTGLVFTALFSFMHHKYSPNKCFTDGRNACAIDSLLVASAITFLVGAITWGEGAKYSYESNAVMVEHEALAPATVYVTHFNQDQIIPYSDNLCWASRQDSRMTVIGHGVTGEPIQLSPTFGAGDHVLLWFPAKSDGCTNNQYDTGEFRRLQIGIQPGHPSVALFTQLVEQYPVDSKLHTLLITYGTPKRCSNITALGYRNESGPFRFMPPSPEGQTRLELSFPGYGRYNLAVLVRDSDGYESTAYTILDVVNFEPRIQLSVSPSNTFYTVPIELCYNYSAAPNLPGSTFESFTLSSGLKNRQAIQSAGNVCEQYDSPLLFNVTVLAKNTGGLESVRTQKIELKLPSIRLISAEHLSNELFTPTNWSVDLSETYVDHPEGHIVNIQFSEHGGEAVAMPYNSQTGKYTKHIENPGQYAMTAVVQGANSLVTHKTFSHEIADGHPIAYIRFNNVGDRCNSHATLDLDASSSRPVGPASDSIEVYQWYVDEEPLSPSNRPDRQHEFLRTETVTRHVIGLKVKDATNLWSGLVEMHIDVNPADCR